MNIVFIFDLDILAFLGRGEFEVCHFELWPLVSGSYWNTHNSSPVITSSKKSGSLSNYPTSHGKRQLVVVFVHHSTLLAPISHKPSSCSNFQK
uniref:Uncharacterized protein n=1 Tax=Panstrongylus lignarius TaxID=156445 RepID=A0A224Y3T1_9HEMI